MNVSFEHEIWRAGRGELRKTQGNTLSRQRSFLTILLDQHHPVEIHAPCSNLNFSSSRDKKSKKKQFKLIFNILFNPIYPKLSFQHVFNTKIVNEIFYIFYTVFKIHVYFAIIVYFSLELAIFQVLNSHKWVKATIADSRVVISFFLIKHF